MRQQGSSIRESDDTHIRESSALVIELHTGPKTAPAIAKILFSIMINVGKADGADEWWKKQAKDWVSCKDGAMPPYLQGRVSGDKDPY